MSKLLIVLPAARDYCGRAVLLSGSGARLLGPFRVLGTASRSVSRRNGNPGCERRLPFGDPPAGSYLLAGSLPPGPRPRRAARFGRLGALVLQPKAGEAMALAGERPRVVLHGGKCDKKGRLRRTRGGLRVSNANLQKLLAAVNRAQADGDPVATVEILDVPQTATGSRERPGGPLARTGRGSSAARGPTAKGSTARGWKAAALLVCGAGVAMTKPVSRRHFLGAALLLCGGLSVAACNHPAPCDPIPCDPTTDPACPPDGYYCADYTVGGGVG